MINKNVVTWVAKKTPNVVLSLTEAEYVAMAEATRMTSYVSNIIESLDLHTQKPSNIGTDNKGAMDLGDQRNQKVPKTTQEKRDNNSKKKYKS